jgi:hypothetical protein
LPGTGRSRPGLRGPADQSPGGVRRELLTFGGIDADFQRVSEEGVEVDGKEIPLTRENRKQVLAAVESLRGKAQPKMIADTIRRRVMRCWRS